MNIYPLRDLVLIKADDAEAKTKSGILLVEKWKTLPHAGEVIAVGKDVSEKFVVGDRVLFERYASVILEDNLRLCKESHLIARLDDVTDD